MYCRADTKTRNLPQDSAATFIQQRWRFWQHAQEQRVVWWVIHEGGPDWISELMEHCMQEAHERAREVTDSSCCIQRAFRSYQARSAHQLLLERSKCSRAGHALTKVARRSICWRRLYHVRVTLPAFFKRRCFVHMSIADHRADLRAVISRITQRWWLATDTRGVPQQTLFVARDAVARITAAVRRVSPRNELAHAVAGLLEIEAAVTREALAREAKRLVYRWGAEQRAADVLGTQVMRTLARGRFAALYAATLQLVNSPNLSLCARSWA